MSNFSSALAEAPRSQELCKHIDALLAGERQNVVLAALTMTYARTIVQMARADAVDAFTESAISQIRLCVGLVAADNEKGVA